MKAHWSRQFLIVALMIGFTAQRDLLRGEDEAEGMGNPREIAEHAREAYEKKDYAEFAKDMELAYRLRPTHQTYLYDLAVAYTLIGKKAQALYLLGEAGKMGFVYPKIAKDTDFNALRGSSEFDAALHQLSENEKPIGHSEKRAVVHEKGLVPEGLAYDPETRTLYVGSVYRRKIIAINADGKATDFSQPQDGLWSVLGMRVDAKRHLLWVCTAAQPQVDEVKKSDLGKSGIFKFDLKTGKLLGKFLLPADKEKHLLGDLTLDDEGNVYTTDSITPAVYVLKTGNDAFEKIRDGGPFLNPQGLAISPDGRHLLVSDYLRGLFLLDLKSNEIIRVAPPAHASSLGIDGIYAVKDGIIGVQNGVEPNRVIRLTLNSNWRRAERCEVLEANNPDFDEPTLGVVTNDHFYFIANSQWGAVDEKGHIAAPNKSQDVLILSLKL